MHSSCSSDMLAAESFCLIKTGFNLHFLQKKKRAWAQIGHINVKQDWNENKALRSPPFRECVCNPVMFVCHLRLDSLHLVTQIRIGTCAINIFWILLPVSPAPAAKLTGVSTYMLTTRDTVSNLSAWVSPHLHLQIPCEVNRLLCTPLPTSLSAFGSTTY